MKALKKGFGSVLISLIFSYMCIAQENVNSSKMQEQNTKDTKIIELACRYQYRDPSGVKKGLIDAQLKLNISFEENATLKVTESSPPWLSGSYIFAKPEVDVYKTTGQYFKYTNQYLIFWYTSHFLGGKIFHFKLDRYTGQLAIATLFASRSDYSEWLRVDDDTQGICNKEADRLF